MRLGEPAWLESAQRAADFIRENLWDGERLSATWREGVAKYAGYLDDYANMLAGSLELLSAQWRDVDAAFARTLADTMIRKFYDADDGGFFFTAHDHEALIHRPKPTLDESSPAGNGTAACALVVLGHLFADTRYLDAASGTLRALRGAVEQYPAGHCTVLSAVEASAYAPEQIIVRGRSKPLAPGSISPAKAIVHGAMSMESPTRASRCRITCRDPPTMAAHSSRPSCAAGCNARRPSTRWTSSERPRPDLSLPSASAGTLAASDTALKA